MSFGPNFDTMIFCGEAEEIKNKVYNSSIQEFVELIRKYKNVQEGDGSQTEALYRAYIIKRMARLIILNGKDLKGLKEILEKVFTIEKLK